MIYLPNELPALADLRQGGFPACGYDLHGPSSIGACTKRVGAGTKKNGAAFSRVLLLNLMPEKQVTEGDFARVLAATGRDVLVVPIKIKGQHYKNASPEHMARFYLDTETVAPGHFDGMIVTGAPLEHLDFEEVRYWPQLCGLMDWAKQHVGQSLYICWAAQAALYHFYGIPKRMLSEKKFGIFPQTVFHSSSRLMEGLSPSFLMPVSRHSEVAEEDFMACGEKNLKLLAAGEESGIGVACDADKGSVYVTGHLEYNRLTLHREYQRDMSKNLPIDVPKNYYGETTDEHTVGWTWHPSAIRFYGNWLDSCIQTPARTQ